MNHSIWQLKQIFLVRKISKISKFVTKTVQRTSGPSIQHPQHPHEQPRAHYAAQPGLPNRCGIITILQPQHLRRPEMWFNTRAANVSPNRPLQEERQCQCQSFILVSVMGGWLADTAMITLCDGDLETHGGRQRGGGGGLARQRWPDFTPGP